MNSKKKQIIATGISGLVGSRVAELFEDKYDFLSFSLDMGVDITDFNLLKKKFYQYPQANIALHLAAFTDVDAAWKQNEDKNSSCYRVNVIGSKNIAQLCAKTKKYLIYISTDFVFDGKNPPAGGYVENSKPHPIEWYGKTKYWAEKEVAKSGCHYSILRIAYPFKAKDSPKRLEPNPKSDLVRKIIAKLKTRQILKMFFDQIITPTFIDDIALAIDKCFQIKPKGIFHCVGSTGLSPYDLASLIAESFGYDKRLIKKTSLKNYLKSNPKTRPYSKRAFLSNKKIEKELGIKMSTITNSLKKVQEQKGVEKVGKQIF